MADLLIMKKRILLDASPVLYDRPFSAESLAEDWEVRNAEWWHEGGAFFGRNPRPGPGCLISRARYPGNVLLDCVARTVPPSTHDIDIMWNMEWDEEKNERGVAYVAGVQGWWEGKIGLEKSPEYKLTAAVPCPWFTPGRDYHLQAGSIDGHCFIFVDGELRLELLDDHPIDAQCYARLGFEAYHSMIRISQLTVRRIAWEPRELSYPDEF
ncbi:MAG: hypothetical protein ACYC6A_17635 [Armatimonadota bacterium]